MAEGELIINEEYMQLFDSLWEPLIPEMMYLEDGDVRAPKILSDLMMFNR